MGLNGQRQIEILGPGLLLGYLYTRVNRKQHTNLQETCVPVHTTLYFLTRTIVTLIYFMYLIDNVAELRFVNRFIYAIKRIYIHTQDKAYVYTVLTHFGPSLYEGDFLCRPTVLIIW